MKCVLPVLLACVVSFAHADPRVVGDAACPIFAVDIAAFATCDGDRVAAFNRVDLAPVLLQESGVPPAKRNFSGLYVDARRAHRLKLDNPDRVVLLDVRSRLEVALVGQPANVDVHVPYLDTAIPLRWDDSVGGWAMSANPSFATEVRQRLERLGVPADAPLLLLCRSGERSARAADALAAIGYAQTISIVDGFEGDVGTDGRRAVNGWKNADLPWTARPVAALVYGAR